MNNIGTVHASSGTVVDLSQVPPGQIVKIETAHSIYEVMVAAGAQSTRNRITGVAVCSNSTAVSPPDQCFCKKTVGRYITVGERFVLGASSTSSTSPVKSVTLMHL